MPEWELQSPSFLWLAGLAPLVYWWAGRRTNAVVYSADVLLQNLPHTWRTRWHRLPPLLVAISVVCLSIALARPRTPDAETRISQEGIAIMLVVDRSGSMEARDLVENDVSVNRLQVVRKVLKQFVLGDEQGVGGRPHDLLGLVSFAGYADSQCPLTTDHHNLVRLVEQLEIVKDPEEDGTAMGDALALAVERLRTSDATSRVIILLTDGVNNAGGTAPSDAAHLAKSFGVKVYTIGAGTNGFAPIPVRHPLDPTRVVLRSQRVSIDEATLKEIAESTGAQYFRATDENALREVYAQIDKLERNEITEIRYLQYTEHFAMCLVPALGLILTSLVLRQTLFRAVP